VDIANAATAAIDRFFSANRHSLIQALVLIVSPSMYGILCTVCTKKIYLVFIKEDTNGKG